MGAIIVLIAIVGIIYYLGNQEQKRYNALTEEEKMQLKLQNITKEIDKITRRNESLNIRLNNIMNYDPSNYLSMKKRGADLAYNKQLQSYHEYRGGYGSEKRYDKLNQRYHRREASYLQARENERKKVYYHEIEIKNILNQMKNNEIKIQQLQEKQAQILESMKR